MRIVLPEPLPYPTDPGGVPVRLRVEPGGRVELDTLSSPVGATHRLVDLLGKPFLAAVEEADPGAVRPADALILALTPPSATAIDLGGDRGRSATLLARKLGRSGALHALESDPRGYVTLAANLLLLREFSGDGPRLEIRRARVGGKGETLDSPVLFPTIPPESFAGLDGFVISAVSKISVGLLRTDRLDAAFLQGAERTLRRDRPVVIASVRSDEAGLVKSVDAARLMESWGYAGFYLVGPARLGPAGYWRGLAERLDAAGVAERIERLPPGESAALAAFPPSASLTISASER